MGDALTGALGLSKVASTAGGGSASTTAPAAILLPKGARYLRAHGRNYSTAVVIKLALAPYLFVLKTADIGATWTDYSEDAQDDSASTDVTLSSLDTLANGDALWVGAPFKFAGLLADVDSANSTASVLSGTYWDGAALSNISLTDNTASGGAALAVDGSITWSVPTDWTPAKLNTIGPASTVTAPNGRAELYWARLVVSAALDASTTLNSLVAIPQAYDELQSGQVFEQRLIRGPFGHAALVHATDAGTANLIAGVSTAPGGRFV